VRPEPGDRGHPSTGSRLPACNWRDISRPVLSSRCTWSDASPASSPFVRAGSQLTVIPVCSRAAPRVADPTSAYHPLFGASRCRGLPHPARRAGSIREVSCIECDESVPRRIRAPPTASSAGSARFRSSYRGQSGTLFGWRRRASPTGSATSVRTTSWPAVGDHLRRARPRRVIWPLAGRTSTCDEPQRTRHPIYCARTPGRLIEAALSRCGGPSNQPSCSLRLICSCPCGPEFTRTFISSSCVPRRRPREAISRLVILLRGPEE